jgi:hypothetical protein
MILVKYQFVRWEPSCSMSANKYDKFSQLVGERALKEMYETGQ